MENSKIEWTDNTFNPWIGCTKVSPGCAHCYAETRSKRTDGVQWGKGIPRKRTSEGNWKQPLKWNRFMAALTCSKCAKEWAPMTWAGWNEYPVASCDCGGKLIPRRARVFCASLSDWLDDEVDIQWLSDLLYLVVKCNNLDWLLLTKRPENWRPRLQAVANHSDIGAMIAQHWLDGHAPPNVWIGTTVEDQTRADERIPVLLGIPARIRFLSCEPLLSRVTLVEWLYDATGDFRTNPKTGSTQLKLVAKPDAGIHWVITGGESGPGARPMQHDWAQRLRKECTTARVPFLFKQWGEWLPWDQGTGVEARGEVKSYPDGSGHIWRRVGKKEAGRKLDGVTHDGFPLVNDKSDS